jgi:MFS family permease
VADTPYSAALTTRGFWALFGVIFAIACTVMLLTVHQNQYLIDIGFNPAFAAWMLGLNGLLRSGGSILWGALSDRLTRQTSFTCSTLLGVVAMLCLLSAQTSPDVWRMVVFVVLIGLGYGGSSVIYSSAAADLFQGRHFGKLGASLGSAIAGIAFDYFQTYRPAFYLTIVLMLASIAGIWLAAPRTAHRTVQPLTTTPPRRPLR